MDRRSVLATGVSLAGVLSAGCTGCGTYTQLTTLTMEPVSDVDIARRATPNPFPEPGNDSEEATDRRRLLRDAIAGDAPTARGTRPPVYPEEAFAYRETVYSVDYTVVESEPATSFGFVLNPAEGSVPDGESIPVADLPTVDRDRLANFGLLDESDPFLGFGSSMLYLDGEIPESMLVPNPTYPYLVWPEATGTIEVDDGNPTELNTYRYTASEVASVEAYGRELLAEYGYRLSGLTPEQRAVVDEATVPPRESTTAGGERTEPADTNASVGDEESTTEVDREGFVVPEGETPSPAVRSLVRRFESVRGLRQDDTDEEIDGTYLVRYDGAVYWTVVTVGAGFTPTETA